MRYCQLLTLLGAVSLPVLAQNFEIGAHGGQSLISNGGLGTISAAQQAISDFSLKDGFRLGFRVTLNNYKFFGHEFGYAYNRTQLRSGNDPASDQGMAIHQGLYDFLAYATPEGTRFRPFAAGGGQFSNFVPPGSSATSGGGSNKLGFNYGGGLKVRVGEMFLIRFDLRQYVSKKPFDLFNKDGAIRQTEISAGFSLAL